MQRAIKMILLVFFAMNLLASCKKDKEEYYEPIEPELQEDYTETAFGMNLEMIYVKGGLFNMGATAEQGKEVWEDEKPVRAVKLDSYHIGKYEVTQAQWKAVMGTDPSYFKGENRPVECVSWNDAHEFCKKLSEQTGKKYVLPTEAQWEYAARGGVHKTKAQFAGSNDIAEVSWYRENCYDIGADHPDYGTHLVGTKKANALSIYDMSGNVWEWCSDWYMDRYEKADDYNPQGPEGGYSRVFRGGSWIHQAVSCRVSRRTYNYPDTRRYHLGFRVACSAE